MRFSRSSVGLALLASVALVGNVYASGDKHAAPTEKNHCVGAGPQAPRDIDKHAGTNPVIFSEAPAIADMNLCNVHFHRNAGCFGLGLSGTGPRSS